MMDGGGCYGMSFYFPLYFRWSLAFKVTQFNLKSELEILSLVDLNFVGDADLKAFVTK